VILNVKINGAKEDEYHRIKKRLIQSVGFTRQLGKKAKNTEFSRQLKLPTTFRLLLKEVSGELAHLSV
jgi:hypothetical protein